MNSREEMTSFHNMSTGKTSSNVPALADPIVSFTYTFENFFHPFVGDLIKSLNESSLAGMLNPEVLKAWNIGYTSDDYSSGFNKLSPKTIDLSINGPYANYNWELLYHIPVMVAVHLSNSQRFVEAQKWFHYVFDPTSTDDISAPQRFWKFLGFRYTGPDDPHFPAYTDIQNIHSLLILLSTPDEELKNDPQRQKEKNAVIDGYNAIKENPFQPHRVARLRPGAYQWYVVMKYLDNLIAWGDSLFLQDSIETINEATLCYVLAANILGPRPQAVPQQGIIKPKNFRQLKEAGLDKMGNALVELEGQFPFNQVPVPSRNNNLNDQSGALFGIGRALYFCIPANQKLLTYWDIVADRLFKIRNSENIQGIVRQLPLFDPPLDPGMLVKAAAAGIDISSIVSGLNQPLGPVRCPLLIQKALELAAEVRSLGNALLASIEKGEAEQLALRRQGHEIELQQKVQNVRYLQWQHVQETTNGLLKTRASALERYTYYLRLLGLAPDTNTVPPVFEPDRRELNEENFDATYSALVGEYDRDIPRQTYTKLQIAGDSAPSNQSGASGSGQIYLNRNEDAELNKLLPGATNSTVLSQTLHTVGPVYASIPDAKVNLHFLGLGGTADIPIGKALSEIARIGGDLAGIDATLQRDSANIASRTASYQRRADEWMLQANLAARELMQIGRQIIASLIAEQIAFHEYQNVKTQIKQAQDIQTFLESKYTNVAFYDWQTSEITRLYYQYYRFAFDTARKAEQTMKRELMRPELDGTQFIQFNYWDSGHKGLMSGEALFLDIKRMEMAYHDNNKRELELTRHVSLRQLDPIALLTLKITGSCSVSIPEWLYDLDCPGHYLRRIKNVGISVPCIVGPYTSINCTLSLQSSSIRVSPLLKDDKYARDRESDDTRFIDYFGAADTIVTSTGNNDTGLFETNLKEERFLPFEGAGAISTWNLSLPKVLRTFDYMTISDVILHIRYTARQAGDPLASMAITELEKLLEEAETLSQALLFSIPSDFPSEWAKFIKGKVFSATLKKEHFPYIVQSTKVTIKSVTIYYTSNGNQLEAVTPFTDKDITTITNSLESTGEALMTWKSEAVKISLPENNVFLVIQYNFKVNKAPIR